MQRLCTLIVACGWTVAASAQVREWSNPAGGFWVLPANWAGGDVPDTQLESARLGPLSRPYTVRSEAGTIRLLDLFIDRDSTLVIAPVTPPYMALFEINGPTLENDGVIELTSVAGRYAAIYFLNGGTFSGGGTVRLRGLAYVNSNYLYPLTNGPEHTIAGTGTVYSPFINEGTIVADEPGLTLQLREDDSFYTSYHNRSRILAINGGVLVLNGARITQTETGVIRADGGAIRLYNEGQYSGGTLEALNGGSIRFQQYGGTMTNMALRGDMTVAPFGDVRFRGRIEHEGTLLADASSAPAHAHIYIESDCTLSGPGEIVLGMAPGSVYDASIFAQRPLTHASDHRIRGNGYIYGTLVNHGRIAADVASGNLILLNGTLTNHGSITATNGSDLTLWNMIIVGMAGGEFSAADSGDLLLASTTMSDVVLNAASPRRIVSVSGEQSLSRVTINGDCDVLAGSSVVVVDSLNNAGAFVVNSNGGNAGSHISLRPASTLGGTGSVVLHATTGQLDQARIVVPSGTATNMPGHTITGVGRITGELVNRGILSPGDTVGPIEHLSGTFRQTAQGEIVVDLNQETADLFGGDASKDLDGTLTVRVPAGLESSTCRSFEILIGRAVTGRFATVNLPPVRVGSLSIQYSPTSVTVIHDPADFNRDGDRSFADYAAFVDAFAGGPSGGADFNGDGFVDFFDYLGFVAAFESPC